MTAAPRPDLLSTLRPRYPPPAARCPYQPREQPAHRPRPHLGTQTSPRLSRSYPDAVSPWDCSALSPSPMRGSPVTLKVNGEL